VMSCSVEGCSCTSLNSFGVHVAVAIHLGDVTTLFQAKRHAKDLGNSYDSTRVRSHWLSYFVLSTRTVAMGSRAWLGREMSVPVAVLVIFRGFLDLSASK
jgi:hypothetical protein